MKSIVLLVLISFFSFSNLFAQIKNNDNFTFSKFNDGLAVATDIKTGKKGLVNTNYDFVTEVEFDKIIFLGEGYYSIIKVKNSGEKSGVVGEGGNILVKAKYDQVWVDKKPNGEPKIIMTKDNALKQKMWTIDKGVIVRDWSI